VVGKGYEFWILLSPALKAQKVVVAATAAAWKGPANARPGLVDCASALFRVEEATDPAKNRILLAPHRILPPVLLLGESAPGVLQGKTMMLSESLHIALIERDQRIGAAVARAFAAIILRGAHASWSPIVEWTTELRCDAKTNEPLA
jgi:hypothetical protein